MTPTAWIMRHCANAMMTQKSTESVFGTWLPSEDTVLFMADGRIANIGVARDHFEIIGEMDLQIGDYLLSGSSTPHASRRYALFTSGEFRFGPMSSLPTLAQLEREFAQRGSEVPFLQDLPTNGSGVQVLTLTDAQDIQTGDSHGAQVISLVRDPGLGAARGTECNTINFNQESLMVPPPTEEGLRAFIIEVAVKRLFGFEMAFRKLAATRVAGYPRSIVLKTTGVSVELVSENLQQPFFQTVEYQLWKETISSGQALSAKQYYQAMEQFIAQTLEGSEVFLNNVRALEESTKILSDANYILVSAFGNVQISHPTLAELGYDSDISSMSRHMIRVAMSHTNATPNDYRDDAIASTSAPGGWAMSQGRSPVGPSLAATGDRVLVREPRTGKAIVQYGTSYSAPLVAATIAHMLEAMPELTREEIGALLTANCWPTGAGTLVEGCGILDPIGAVYDAITYSQFGVQPVTATTEGAVVE